METANKDWKEKFTSFGRWSSSPSAGSDRCCPLEAPSHRPPALPIRRRTARGSRSKEAQRTLLCKDRRLQRRSIVEFVGAATREAGEPGEEMANSLATSCAASPAASPATRALAVAGRGFPDKTQLSFSKSSSSRKCTLRPRSWVCPMAVYADGYCVSERSSCKGIWSIRDDLQMPSSPYFPVEAQGGQGPPPMVQERFQSVISQLFQHRIIRCGGAVDDDMANIIVAQLLYLDAVDPKKDIVMYVNSPGGSVTAGMAIFDTMRHIRPDVSTVCVGLAASMGAFLLSAGTKGKRYSLPNSRIMIHQPLGGAQGGQTDIDIQANEMLHHKANLNGYLAYHTGQSLERINQDTDRDFFMSAKEAKEYGLIDGVIMNPLKALQPLPATDQ